MLMFEQRYILSGPLGVEEPNGLLTAANQQREAKLQHKMNRWYESLHFKP